MTARDPPRVERENFTTSRLAEFTSVNALTAAIGHGTIYWPLVIVKECTDNGIDKAEELGIAPVIAITVDANGIAITDNGGGIDPATVARVIDYNTTTSSREAYVEPTRGRQGNALQTILAIPFAVDGERGVTTIESKGVKHTITFTMDPKRRFPVIAHTDERTRRFVKNGTRITVELACSQDDPIKGHFVRFAQAISALNPHLTITLTWHGNKLVSENAADPNWPKWKPSSPLLAHWYSGERFARLVGAKVAHDEDHGRDTLVREFVATFKGMTSTAVQKAVLNAMDLQRTSLATLFEDRRHGKLLAMLKDATKPGKPADLGVIGEDRLRSTFAMYGSDIETFHYSGKITGETDGLPWMIEAAFAWCPNAKGRVLFTGCNWTPSLGETFDGLGAELAGRYVEDDDPVLVAVHLAYPAAVFTDKGKTELALPSDIAEAVETAVGRITKAWTQQRKREERHTSKAEERAERLSRRKTVSQKDAAWDVMEKAYLAASANGTLPANARQIMYAARPHILEMTGGDRLGDAYFTQTLLPDFINEHPDLTAAWKIAYDDRGHLEEPHIGRRIGLGTLAVDRYIKSCQDPTIMPATLKDAYIATHGPKGRYGALLYVEKEGFQSLFDATQLAARYDLAIMSSKGMSVVAARKLAEAVCSKYRIPLLTLHDFDKAGMSIAASFERNNRRYTFEKKFKVIDLGLRLDDVDAEGLLGSAESHTDRGSEGARAANLRENGATKEEVEFLLDKRVELNAFTSDAFIEFIERKLEENGVGKVVPNKAMLTAVYRAIVQSDLAKGGIEAAIAEAAKTRVAVPADLKDQIDAYLEDHREAPWDAAVVTIVRGPKKSA